MNNVWCELKYGPRSNGITLCKLDDPHLLGTFRDSALKRAREHVEESEGVDEVVHLQDEMELERLERLLGLLVPSHRKRETLHV